MPRTPGNIQGTKPEYSITLHMSPAVYARIKFMGDIHVFVEEVGGKLTTRIRLTKRQIIEYYNAKYSLAEFALITGWSRETVRRKLQALGLDTSVFPNSRQEVAVNEEDPDIDTKPTGKGGRNRYGHPVWGIQPDETGDTKVF